MALLSPERLPASGAGPARGRCELLLSCGGHQVEPDHKQHHVQDGVGHLEAGPLVRWGGHAVLDSACQEGWVDVVP